VESSCELGNEPSGSIKCWELPSGCTTCGLSSGTQLPQGWLVSQGQFHFGMWIFGINTIRYGRVNLTAPNIMIINLNV
jgi:hypothetical protein